MAVLDRVAVVKLGVECNARGSFRHHSDPHLAAVNHVRIFESDWEFPNLEGVTKEEVLRMTYVCIS